jgi:hypothetical protein
VQAGSLRSRPCHSGHLSLTSPAEAHDGEHVGMAIESMAGILLVLAFICSGGIGCLLVGN